MINKDKITEIYFIIDEFLKEFNKVIAEHSIGITKVKKRNRKFTLSDSEVMTIVIFFTMEDLGI